MLHIQIGYQCGDGSHCDKYKQCKYRAKWYKLHNLSVAIHNFFEYRLHVKLPRLICIYQKWERLSGTDKCPFHKSRHYTCCDCRYICGDNLEECCCPERYGVPLKERLPDVETDGWGKRCAYFDKCAWADDYKEDVNGKTYKWYHFKKL